MLMVLKATMVWKVKVTLNVTHDRVNENQESIGKEQSHDLDRHDFLDPLVCLVHEVQLVYWFLWYVLHRIQLDEDAWKVSLDRPEVLCDLAVGDDYHYKP
ncbi:hypothetical protein Sjap_024163 [Stephania japonica]|uniref:Uncharacterized protein n=1 Tax=Stephania japonica TaxID=461633 RepID=A0AAP0ECY0_9MAGN